MREMKDSGIPWIGEIPSDWKILRLKQLLANGKDAIKVGPFGSQLSGSDFTNDGFWVYNQQTVINHDFSKNDTFINHEKFNAMKSFQVRASDILITTRGTIGKICRIPKNFHEGIIHPCIIKFRVDDTKILYNIIEMLFNNSDLVKNQLNYMSNATTIDVIYSSTLKNIYIPVAPIKVQRRIADYLDSKCAKIDSIKKNVELEIEAMKQYKKSVITEAVTKGLDKNVEMKDSGIPWCPQIPEHWIPTNPKALFHQKKERARKNDKQLTASQKYGIVFQDEFMKIENQKVVTVAKDFDILKHVEPNDFVISMRSFQGGLEFSKLSGCISSAYVMLIPNFNLVYPSFYKWFFKSDKYINAIQSTTNLIRDGQAMRFANFVLVPLFIIPLDEQRKIANYLDTKCAKIDSIIQKKQELLTNLDTYKKSLIYEYVTGKKEVPAV